MSSLTAAAGKHCLKEYTAPEGIQQNLTSVSGWRTGMVGMANYNNTLRIAYSSQGLHLSVVWPFSLAHPPLLIPWRAVQEVKTVGWIISYERLQLTNGRTISLPKKVVEQFQTYLPSR